MLNALSCERLLRRLSVESPHDAITMCAQVLGQCRRGQVQDAIRTAESALRLARADYTAAGVVLLYLSYARLSSQSDDQITPVLQDADRAVRLLSLDPFNQAIAYVFRANVELECEGRPCGDEGHDRSLNRTAQALVYLHRANSLLLQLIQSGQEYNRVQQVRRCRVLQAMLCQKISQFEALLAEDAVGLLDVPMSVKLIWPISESAVKIEIQSIGQGFVPDYLESNHLTIAGESFRVSKPTLVGFSAGSVRLHSQQVYWVIPLCDDAWRRQAIVRRRVRPDRDQQLVAYYDDTTDSALIDQVESNAPYTHIRVIGRGRDWFIAENANPDPRYIGGPCMIGVVEAFLIPE